MKLQQLRFLRQVVASDLNVTAAAQALHTSQSGVSRQIRMLEEELGATIFQRRQKRLLGLTDVGRELVRAAADVVERSEQLRHIAADFEAAETGELTVATTHLHARYALLPVIAAFARAHPNVTLRLIQTFPAEIFQLLDSDEADLGLTIEESIDGTRFESLPAYPMDRCLITPVNHPLLKRRRPSLAEIARHPLIVYDSRLSSGRDVAVAFREARIEPNVVLRAFDVDVIKAYVAVGLGVAIVPSLAYERGADPKLRAVLLGHLLPRVMTSILVRRGKYLRRYARTFVELLAPAAPATRARPAVAAGRKRPKPPATA